MTDLWEPVSGAFWHTAPLLPDLGLSLDGSFYTTIIGALAGAGIGAWAAGHIAERNKIREQLTKEIRDTNAAITLALSATNSGLMLKKRVTLSLEKNYIVERRKILEVIAIAQTGKPQTITGKIDLINIGEITPPIPHLQDIVLSRLSTAGRALSSIIELNEAVINLNAALAQRNTIISAFKKNELPAGASKEAIYFGLPYGNGETNDEYRSLITAISLYTDDVIFFGNTLCEDLYKHGKFLAATVKKKRLLNNTPAIHDVDFSAAQRAGLIPNAKDYPPPFNQVD